MNIKAVLAIDPGTSKCGIALVHLTENKIILGKHQVCKVEEMSSYLNEIKDSEFFELIILGKGTYSKRIKTILQEVFPKKSVLLVDEKDTTFEARAKYWEYHKRKGWRKFIPSSMQVPPEPIDDFVALILAERFLKDT